MSVELAPHELRVVEERNELEERIARLGAFFESKTFSGMSEVDQTLMHEEHFHMSNLSEVLSERIDRFVAKAQKAQEAEKKIWDLQ